MNKFYLVYRPATKEYLQFFDNESTFGPHIAWTCSQDSAFQFGSHRKVSQVAETISRVDRLRMQIITFKEEGRNTIEAGEATA